MSQRLITRRYGPSTGHDISLSPGVQQTGPGQRLAVLQQVQQLVCVLPVAADQLQAVADPGHPFASSAASDSDTQSLVIWRSPHVAPDRPGAFRYPTSPRSQRPEQPAQPDESYPPKNHAVPTIHLSRTGRRVSLPGPVPLSAVLAVYPPARCDRSVAYAPRLSSQKDSHIQDLSSEDVAGLAAVRRGRRRDVGGLTPTNAHAHHRPVQSLSKPDHESARRRLAT
jgi:hypothetical protein